MTTSTTTRLAQRAESLQPSVFAWLNVLKTEALAAGGQLIDLGIGSPDRPTPRLITEALARAVSDPACHGYPAYRGSPVFLEAAARFLRARFGVEVDPATEVVCVSGGEEGFTQIGLAFLDEGSVSLVPDIHYPIHARSAALAGARVELLPLTKENGFLPVLSDIPESALRDARMLIVNYPHNPTGAIAPMSFFEEAVAFCQKHGLLLVSDLAYSELTFDGYVAPSVLQVPGARDVAIELHSFSKTFNMAGFRIAFVAGNAAAVDALFRIRSNFTYGVPTSIQDAAALALDNFAALAPNVASVYRGRRDAVTVGMRALGCPVSVPKGSMFMWLPVPDGYTSQEWSQRLIEQAGVVVTPGNAFGPGGEGWFRLSLVADANTLNEAIRRIGSLEPKWRTAA